MNWTPELIRIRDILAGLFPLKEELPRLIEAAGLAVEAVNLDGTVSAAWHDIIKKAVSSGSLDALVEECNKPSVSPKLQEAYQDYLSAPPPHDPAPAPAIEESLSQSFAGVLCIAPPPAAEQGLRARPGRVRLLSSPPKEDGRPQGLHEVIREAVSVWQEAHPGAFECEPRWEGVLVVARSDHAALLRLALHISLTVVTQEGERPRLGLHFVPVAGAAKPPYEGEFVARRLALLGRGGHFLATDAARTFVEAGPALASVLAAGSGHEQPVSFRLAGVAPLRLNEPTQIYNVVGDGFGNAERPSLKLPEPVVVKFPRTLLEARKARIKAVFWEGLPYAKVEFEFKDKGDVSVTLDCEKPSLGDCVFELDFERLDDRRAQSFGIELLDRANRKSVTLLLRCYDRFGEQLAPEIKRPPIRLRRHYLLWLWDGIKFSRWYVKTALALAAALVVAAPVYVAGPWRKFWEDPEPRKQETAEPEVMPDQPPLYFVSAVDTGGYWDMSPPAIAFGQGHGESTNNALDLNGPRAIFLKPELLKGRAFYDFKLALMIKLKPGTKMGGWVLRAQPGSRRGYWFALERKPDNKLVLHGTYVADDNTDLTAVDDSESEAMNRLGLPLRDIPVGDFLENDWAEVMITVSGNKFSHKIRRKSGTEGITDSGIQPLATDFVDTNPPRFRNGSLGLWAPNGGGMLVDYWVVSNSHK